MLKPVISSLVSDNHLHPDNFFFCVFELVIYYWYVSLVLSNQIWVMALSVCFIFTVTIGTFPAVTVDVKSTVAGGGAWGESPSHPSYKAWGEWLPCFCPCSNIYSQTHLLWNKPFFVSQWEDNRQEEIWSQTQTVRLGSSMLVTQLSTAVWLTWVFFISCSLPNLTFSSHIYTALDLFVFFLGV